MESLFWADQIAEQIIERSKREKRIPNIKCQQTPSGGKHIGNLNDVVRAYYPYKSLQVRGVKTTFVHTTDDRDPLKDIPKRLPDAEGKWHESSTLMDMKLYFGKPLCRIPDPFGCCTTWSAHFTEIWMKGVYVLGMKPTLYSVDTLYKEEKFEPYIRKVFEKRNAVGKIVSTFQKTKSEGYLPFDAICPSCGRLINVQDADVKTKKVFFKCEGKAIKKKKSEGCGFEGSVPWSEGKLQWRFEWPALWGIFQTTYEPFGKDHFEGSWKSGVVIAKEVFGIEPPIPFVYEFFLVNGEKMSASVGNVYIVQDMLKIMEPEVFMYFYTKRPGKQRNFDLKNVNLLVEDFEMAERVFFGAGKEGNEKERKNIERSYEMCMASVPEKQPLRIPYLFASMIAQSGLDNRGVFELLKETGHGKEFNKEEQEIILKRVEIAGYWARNYADERYLFSLKEHPEAKLSEKQKAALRHIGEELLKKKLSEAQIAELFRRAAEENHIDARELFQGAYKALLGRDSGPRLSHFILAAGREKVANILKKI